MSGRKKANNEKQEKTLEKNVGVIHSYLFGFHLWYFNEKLLFRKAATNALVNEQTVF